MKIDKDTFERVFKKYSFPVKFKDGTRAWDMKAGGYIEIGHETGLQGISSELLHFSKDNNERYAVVKVTTIFEFGKFDAIADCDDRDMSVRDPSMLIRVCETKALKRSIARALGITPTDMNARDEEVHTPAPDTISQENKEQQVTEEPDWGDDEW